MLWNQFWQLSIAALAGLALVASRGRALSAQSGPGVGSPNVAIADPPVPRPGTSPCAVQLFPKERFGLAGEDTRMDAVPHFFKYQPPAGCKAPWAKVVLEADFSVDAGHQYDRTASIWLNDVNLYFGTTEEPSPSFGPSWRVERDLTDYTSLLRSPGEGAAQVNNWVDAKRGSMIYASARILFYPADLRYSAPRAPDALYSLNGARNAAANLQTGNDQLQRRIAFPRNTRRVYMDLFAQSQFHDEFWYTCLPNEYIRATMAFAMKRGYRGAPVHPRACSGGSFREVEVSIDGQPAGLAPIYPWVYTGGIDPFLWRPTPGLQTLNFLPFRVDLTPFTGLLSDGAHHSVSVRVLGANHYFSVAAVLLVYRDSHAKETRGRVTRNTLARALLKPTVTSTLGTSANGNVLTRAKQSYVIEGYINTPAGRVRTRVEQSILFANTQRFRTVDAQTLWQVTEQTWHAESTSSSTRGASSHRSFRRSLDYSLTAAVLKRSSHGGSSIRTTHLQQSFEKHIEQDEEGQPPYRASIRNARTAADQMTFNPERPILASHTGQTSAQAFAFTDSLGDCYTADVESLGGRVSRVTVGQGCGRESMHWFVHPNGSPDSFGWRKNATR